MSVKHVKEYYKQVCDQYQEMLENIQDCEKDLENQLVSPEYIDNLRQQIEPVKNNYMTMSWIMHLLNQPNRKSKVRPYQERMKKVTDKIDKQFKPDKLLEENQMLINSLKHNKDE